jgi:hypothetical protein
MDEFKQADLFDHAVRVAACSHIATCRAEFARIGGVMPLPNPAPDYVGPDYRGLVVIAGNPGLAHAGVHNDNDALMLALQARVARGDQRAFEELMAFLPDSMEHWPQMVNADARRSLRYDIREIAYVEIVKCATRPLGSNLRRLFHGTNVLTRCWETHTRALLEALAPTHIVALWKPIIPTLQALEFNFPEGARIGSYNGNRSFSSQRRYAEVVSVFDAYYGR